LLGKNEKAPMAPIAPARADPSVASIAWHASSITIAPLLAASATSGGMSTSCP
jgi:hypothetical protein